MTFNELRRLHSSNSIERLPELKNGMILTTSSKLKFKAIMSVLKGFYGVIDTGTKTRLRFSIVDMPTTEFDVGVGKIDGENYQYIVIIKHGNRYESFTHYDGIQEEREKTTDRSHPVFRIECLTDILVYNADYVKIEEVDNKVIDNKVINGWG